MKIIKLSLAIVVAVALAIFIIQSINRPIDIEEPKLAEDQFTFRVLQEIDTLSKLPKNRFSKEYYDLVTYHIEDFHKNGNLGVNTLENDQQKENLSKRLYSTYIEKFIDQTFNVFNQSEWKSNDLNFIRTEYQSLQISQYLEKDSPIDLKLNEIRTILNQYDIIVNFISSCKYFTFTEMSLSEKFPHQEVLGLINQSIRFRQTGLGNSFVNNCIELRNQMKGVPNVMFLKHIEYLDNKIDAWSGMYTNYKTQKAYADNLYFPIKREIEELNNDIYNSPNFNNEFARIKRKWDVDSNKAYAYF